MSISVTVSGEDATSVVLEQVLSDAVTVSESNSIQVTTTSGDAATVTISTGDPVTVTGNYSNYVTGDVVRPNEISDFLTSAQISSNINSAIDSLIDSAPDALNTLNELAAALNDDENFGSDTIVSISNLNSATGQLSTATGLLVQKSETGIFYTNDNPSGFITSVDLSDLEAATGNFDLRITLNDGDISTLQTATGLLVQKTETGDFVTTFDTGAFYANSNPSGFITGVDLSSYVQNSETGDFITDSDTGAFYATSNPSGFITGVDLSDYVEKSETGAFYATSNPSGFITGVDLSSYVQNSETGLFLVSGGDAVVNTIGVGTSSPDELLHLEATSQPLTREVLMKATVSDAGNDQFGIANGTSTNSNFAPSFYGYKDSNYGNGYIYSMNFRGLVPDAQDTTQTNRFGIVHFEAFKTNNAADPNNGTFNSLTNRKLFTFSNGGNTVLEIDADNTVTISQDLSVSGDSSFSNRPTVNGTGVLLSGEGGGGTVENVVHTTGDQTISGVKTFLSRLEVSSSTTDDTVLITTTEDSSDAAPVLTLKRNSSSISNGDYLGQIKFKGENDADQEIVYAKITAKISDDTDTTEDGLIEFAMKKDGSNVIVARQTSSDLKLINGVGLEVDGSATFGSTLNVDQNTTLNSGLSVEGPTTVGKISLSENSFVTETGSFTMGSTHRGATVLLQNSAPITVTIPAQVSGHTTTFIAETSNSVVFATGAGISGFNSFNSANQIAGIYGQAQIIFKSPEYAFLGGNVV